MKTKIKFIVPLVVVVVVIGGLYLFLNNNKNQQNLVSTGCTNDNTLPMYGCGSYDEYITKRSDQQKKADDDLIKTILSANNNDSIKASNYTNKRGWDYSNSGDFITARKRFNQAWLIDHNNFVTFWQFAISYAKENKKDLALVNFERAVAMYDEKYKVSKNDLTTLICDRGLSYLTSASLENDVVKQKDLLNKTVSTIESQTKNSNYISSQCLLTEAQAYGALGDNANAKGKINEAIRIEPALKNSDMLKSILQDLKMSL